MKMQSTLKQLFTVMAISSSAFFVSCGEGTTAENTDADSTDAKPTRAEATLSGTKSDTAVTGTVSFEAGSAGKVKMVLQISVPSKANQSIAAHLHEHGNCGDTATHAGGHWNPTGTNHGKWGEGSFHSGDIGNIDLDAQGNGRVELESELWSIGGDANTNILEKTVVIHSGVDDYSSQPAGNSGPRIGCGIIRAPGAAAPAVSTEHSTPH